jgi:uncharacterized spore protein YtfJ
MAEENLATAAQAELANPDRVLDVMEDTMEKFLSAASVEAVYGKPVKNGDTLIIPSAEVLSGMGFGVGFGSGSGGESHDEDDGDASGTPAGGSGGGGGGGGRVLSRPVAVIIASPEGVRIEPVVDVTKVALAALTAGGFMVGMLLRMLGRREAD